MSFLDEVLPVRDNADALAGLLLARISSFSQRDFLSEAHTPRELVSARCAPEHRRFLGFPVGYVHHCTTDSEGNLVVPPRNGDLQTIRALLKAWKGDVSDRFLSKPALIQLARTDTAGIHRSHDDEETKFARCYEHVSRNFPAGAVKFVRPELNSHRMLFGDGVRQFSNYNQYFSVLLAWDDYNCFGLVAELARQANLLNMGGNTSQGVYYQCARTFIARAQNHPGTLYRYASR